MSGRLRHYRDWLWVFVFLSILIAYALWYLQQNPPFIYPLAIAFFVAIIFLTLSALRPEYRQGIIRRLLGLHKRDLERGGWFHRYGKLAGILIIINALIFRLMVELQFVSTQDVQAILLFIYIQMALGTVLLVSFLRVAGKWL
ncbi:MAG: hypothetical protein OEY81_08070, partial [Candidatus Bathyarchaeota archaeon]|nr:hypothetical protein [Candidatus Bathyarchaeota archaeon]